MCVCHWQRASSILYGGVVWDAHKLRTLAQGNVERIIKFMVDSIQDTQHTPLLDVFRTVAVFLGRVQPQLTVGYLIDEIRSMDVPQQRTVWLVEKQRVAGCCRSVANGDLGVQSTTQVLPPNLMSWTFTKLFPITQAELV
jgi:hypothetical protein